MKYIERGWQYVICEDDPTAVEDSFLKLLNENGALLTAGDSNAFNTMMISSGAIGNLFRRNVIYAYVRPDRYTRIFMDNSDYFTVSFFDVVYQQQVELCGKTSGRETDKVKATGFTPGFTENGFPYFWEAEYVYVGEIVDVLKKQH